MPLPYGCTERASELFKNRIGAIHIQTIEKNIIIGLPNVNSSLTLSPILGDCTACTVNLEFLRVFDVNKVFTIIQEYMSINARISCFFSLKKDTSQIPAFLTELQKFPIAGLHLQKSNREPDSNKYMITGILKVPNPICNTYEKFDQIYPDEHNNNKVTKINLLNTEHKLQTF